MVAKKSRKKINIAFAGGGTGGHVRPIQSLIEYVDKVDTLWTQVGEVVWIGTKGAFEHKMATELASYCQHVNIDFAPISSGKLRRERSPCAIRNNIVDIFFRVPRGIIKSFVYLRGLGIDAVFCKGGYVAIPVVIAAWLLRIPIYVHESDTSAGLTNKIANKFARKSFTGFDGVFEGATTVGQILSDKLLEPITGDEEHADEFATILGEITKAKHDGKTLVFVSGGSLGSRVLYSTLFEQVAHSEKLKEDFIFVVILGILNDEAFDISDLPENILTIPFVTPSQMGRLMELGDIGVVRGGTTTLAECKIFDMPLIIAPLPITHDQFKNAAYYKKKYEDIILDQRTKTFGRKLKDSLLGFTGYQKKLSDKDRQSKINKSKEIIMNDILSLPK